ncbi:MAG: DUF695 domain-containing protein [Muribaculaceae bacterium]|nr:DUF695 domain-containing protein [Muribaculaceae bacterium]
MSQQVWWTAPALSENGNRIMVSGRKDIERFRENPRFSIRVEISWPYTPDAQGFPDEMTSELMEQAHEALEATFAKDPVAVLTGVFTGDGRRDWVFYTLSTNIFGRKLNEALAHLPLLPLEIKAENDPEWEAYSEMADAEIKID